METLKCSINPSGNFFTINDNIKDSLFSVGTTGVLSCVLGSDHNNSNIIYQDVVITRRGKKGKRRLENVTLLTPIFKVPELAIEEIIPKSAERKGFVDIDVDEDTTIETIKTLPDYDFVSWVYSRLKFIHRLDQVCYPGNNPTRLTDTIASKIGLNNNKHVSIWPKDGRIVNFFNDISAQAQHGGGEIPIDDYVTQESRTSLLLSLRKLEASLVIPRLAHQQRICSIFVDALDFLEKTLSEKKTENVEKMIKNTREETVMKINNIEKAIKARLDILVKSRKLLENEPHY